MQYNPKNRPRPSQILNHEFFKTKLPTSSLLKTAGQSETTADTSKSRVESLVIGASGLQLKTKVVTDPPAKAKKSIRNSIEAQPVNNATILEPIMENALAVGESEKAPPVKFQNDAQAISAAITQAFEDGYKHATIDQHELMNKINLKSPQV